MQFLQRYLKSIILKSRRITQALLDLTQVTAAKGGDPMNNLRQIATKILQNPSDPLIDKIIGLAQTKSSDSSDSYNNSLSFANLNSLIRISL